MPDPKDEAMIEELRNIDTRPGRNAGGPIDPTKAYPPAIPTSADVIEGMRWRLIESAPKDGTRILLADHKNLVTGFWSPPNNGWRCDWQVGEPGDKPTHWMPLPALPDSKPDN